MASLDGNPRKGPMDLSELNRTEQTLPEREQLLRNVARHAHCILWSGTVTGLPGWDQCAEARDAQFVWRVTVLDEEAAQQVLPLDVAPGQNYCHVWEASGDPQDRLDMGAAANRALLRSDTHYTNEFRCTDRFGRLHWLHEEVSLEPVSHGCWHVYGIVIDVTQRKMAELALQESEEMLAASQRIAHLGSWDYDHVNDVLRWSAETYRIFGVDEASFTPTFSGLLAMIHPDDRKRVQDAIGQSESEKVPYRVEHRIRRPDGTERIVHEEGRFFYDNTHRAVRSIGMVFDVTEQRLAEWTLRGSARHFRAIFDRAPYGIAVIDSHTGRFVQANQKCCDIVGYSQEEMMSLDFQTLTHPEDLEEDLRNMARLLHGEIGEFVREKRYLRKDRSVVWVSLKVVPLWSENQPPAHHLAMVEDITSRKRTEEALQASEASLRAAQRIAHVGSWEWNIQTDTASWSDETFRIFGLSCEMLEQHRRSFVEMVHPDDRNRVDQELSDALSGAKEYSLDYRVRRLDGSERFVHAQAQVLRDSNGKPSLMRGTIHDVTDRKKAEADRLDLERRLLHAQKLESLGILAGGIAHDFNNLLTVVLGQADLALQRLSPESPLNANLQEAVHAARRAADLTRQMLAYSGKGNFTMEQVDLGALVDENAHLLRSVVPRTITMNLHLAPELPPIHADRAQMQQVVMNLIANASEAIGDEPGTITLTTSLETLDEATLGRSRNENALPPGQFICLTVSDTGCGMSEIVLRQLFDPFFTTKFTGRGLGMSVVMGVVRGHGGVIFVDSEPGAGTTFRIGFPLSPGTAAGNLAKPHPTALPTENITRLSGLILIVDDEEPVRNLCKTLVQSLGCDVVTAQDGHQALEVFDKYADQIACVILDLSMPRMDGKRTFSELQRRRPGVKVLLASGYSQAAADYPAGSVGFLQKPFTLDDLEMALRQALLRKT